MIIGTLKTERFAQVRDMYKISPQTLLKCHR